LRFRCRREKSAIVVFEQLDPMRNVAGVANFFVDPELSTNKSRGELGD
jgi:hypothetical protein